MDGLKLQKWQADFSIEVARLQTEFDAFFTGKPLEDFYELKVNETSQNLSLEIKNKERLPHEIEKRLTAILEATRPEDSI